MTTRLNTIQKHNNLNAVDAVDEPGVGSASHLYVVRGEDDGAIIATIAFQHGPRKAETSTRGVLDCDLLEIVRDRLKGFQSSPFACRENAVALTHVETALLWMDKRVQDRAERGVLGTTQQ